MFPRRILLIVLPAILACDDGAAPTGPGELSPSPSHGKTLTREQMQLPTLAPGLRGYMTHAQGPAASLQAEPVSLAAKGAAGIVSDPTDLGARLDQESHGFSFAYGINESGQVAGFAAAASGSFTPDAVRWEADGTPVVLPKGSPDGQASAMDVSDAGVVVGVDNEIEPGGGFIQHAMRWNPDGSFAQLPEVPDAISHSAEAIAGDLIVGWVQLGNLETRAVRWDEQGIHLLPSVGPFTAALDVNEAGTAVGYTGPGLIPALWTPAGELRLLEMPRGDNFGFAAGINNLGEVIGTTGVNTGGNGPGPHHAVTWSPNGKVHVVPRSENTTDDFSDGTAINDAGVIAGSTVDRATGLKTAFILAQRPQDRSAAGLRGALHQRHERDPARGWVLASRVQRSHRPVDAHAAAGVHQVAPRPRAMSAIRAERARPCRRRPPPRRGGPEAWANALQSRTGASRSACASQQTAFPGSGVCGCAFSSRA